MGFPTPFLTSHSVTKGAEEFKRANHFFHLNRQERFTHLCRAGSWFCWRQEWLKALLPILLWTQSVQKTLLDILCQQYHTVNFTLTIQNFMCQERNLVLCLGFMENDLWGTVASWTDRKSKFLLFLFSSERWCNRNWILVGSGHRYEKFYIKQSRYVTLQKTQSTQYLSVLCVK